VEPSVTVTVSLGGPSVRQLVAMPVSPTTCGPVPAFPTTTVSLTPMGVGVAASTVTEYPSGSIEEPVVVVVISSGGTSTFVLRLPSSPQAATATARNICGNARRDKRRRRLSGNAADRITRVNSRAQVTLSMSSPHGFVCENGHALRPVATAAPALFPAVRYWWTTAIAMLPSPTPADTRLMEPWRTSPTASTPGTLVSRR